MKPAGVAGPVGPKQPPVPPATVTVLPPNAPVPPKAVRTATAAGIEVTPVATQIGVGPIQSGAPGSRFEMGAPKNAATVIVSRAIQYDLPILSLSDEDLVTVLDDWRQPHWLHDRIVRLRARKVLALFNEVGDDNIVGRGGLDSQDVTRAKAMLEGASQRGPAGGRTHVEIFRRIVELEAILLAPKTAKRPPITHIDLSGPVTEFAEVTNDVEKRALVDKKIQDIREAHRRRFSRSVADNIAGSTGKGLFTSEEAMKLAKKYGQVLVLDAEEVLHANARGRIHFARHTRNFILGLNDLIHSRLSDLKAQTGFFDGPVPDNFMALPSEDAKWAAVRDRAQSSSVSSNTRPPDLFLDILNGKRSPTLSGLLKPEEAWAYIANLQHAVTTRGSRAFNLAVWKELKERMEKEALRLRIAERDRKTLEKAPVIRERLAAQVKGLSGPARTEAEGHISELDAAIEAGNANKADHAIFSLNILLRQDKGTPVFIRAGGQPQPGGNIRRKGGS